MDIILEKIWNVQNVGVPNSRKRSKKLLVMGIQNIGTVVQNAVNPIL
jgi:hypothetical protein